MLRAYNLDTLPPVLLEDSSLVLLSEKWVDLWRVLSLHFDFLLLRVGTVTTVVLLGSMLDDMATAYAACIRRYIAFVIVLGST